MSSIYGVDLSWEFVNPVGTFMSVFRDRIQAIKRTLSNIETDVHLYPGKLRGSNSGSFPNVHAGVYYYSNMPHFWVVKIRVQTCSAPSLKPVLTWNVTIGADVHDDVTEGCFNGGRPYFPEGPLVQFHPVVRITPGQKKKHTALIIACLENTFFWQRRWFLQLIYCLIWGTPVQYVMHVANVTILDF